MIRSLLCSALVIGSLTACGPMHAPVTMPPRTAQPVQASVARTWEAVIDVFADRNIPIKTMDRASGFIATEGSVGSAMADSSADCGSYVGVHFRADHADYNVVVRGDSSVSTVKVTATWVRHDEGSHSASECPTRGYFESMVEANIKTRAEAAMHTAAAIR
jgi:hypothetical protein